MFKDILSRSIQDKTPMILWLVCKAQGYSQVSRVVFSKIGACFGLAATQGSD